MKSKDLIGNRYGRLIVVSKCTYKKNNKSVWKCLCNCGKTTFVVTDKLTTGRTKSCGCLQQECRNKIGERTKTHGLSKTKTYKTWLGMRERCNNKNHHEYLNYGGRGIKVCKRWDSYINFLNDMGEKEEGMSLDRINVNGNYEPTNCKWSTWIEQCNNKRNNRHVFINGNRYTWAEAARKLNMTWGYFLKYMRKNNKMEDDSYKSN